MCLTFTDSLTNLNETVDDDEADPEYNVLADEEEAGMVIIFFIVIIISCGNPDYVTNICIFHV